jgi:hypothetical protein
MTTKFMLNKGTVFRAEDVTIVDDEPGARTPMTVLKHPKETRQGQLDLQAKKKKPWEDLHPELTQPFNLRLSKILHAKLKHCGTIVPGGISIQKIALTAIEAHVAELLKKYDHD